MRIKLPFRSMLVGASGSGKTNILMNLIRGIGVFNKVVLIARDLEEPLYKFLQDALRAVEQQTHTEILTVGNNIDDIPNMDDFDTKNNNLLIIDDMISEKESKLNNVSAIWIRGRKKNVSTVFITQSYFKTPLLIRQNTDYIFLRKIASVRDLKRIVSEYALDVSPETLLTHYNKATGSGDITDFFLIDLNATDNYKYRHNYSPIITN